MSAPATISALLSSLTQSLASAQEVTPRFDSIPHQKDGISLLDVKNELLLSYLQNLVFLILLKLRNAKSEPAGDGHDANLDESVRAKLVELRLYLERGARPLEEKLRFSIERFLRSAEDAERQERASHQRLKNGKVTDDSDSESDSESQSGSEDDSEEEHAQNGAHTRAGAKRGAAPNLAAMVDDITSRNHRGGGAGGGRGDNDDDGPSGVYRPPKRERQLMEAAATRPREKSERRANRSTTMDEFVASELSAAPVAEPSVGTTIVQGGRKMKTSAERAREDERREYEETNFVRLPKESKKDKAKKAKTEGRGGRMTFGGEEFRDLGEGVDRIDRLTRRKEGGGRGGGVKAMLDRSRKRGIDTTDGPRGSGAQMGERFQKRVKTLEAGRRDRGNKRR